MSLGDFAPGARIVLLDIEGTTTPISFVHETLFPFARKHLDRYLDAHWSEEEIKGIVHRLAGEHEADRAQAPPWRDDSDAHIRESVTAYLRWLMAADRKSPGLKELQGLIWEEGYQAGELKGVVWEDVPRAMRRWRIAGLSVAIYSSGSELAQRRLFASTRHGDLTPLIASFFDTSVGGKLVSESYLRIAALVGVTPMQIAFVSDVTAELRAARGAGCETILSVRSGNLPQPDANDFPAVSSFDEL